MAKEHSAWRLHCGAVVSFSVPASHHAQPPIPVLAPVVNCITGTGTNIVKPESWVVRVGPVLE